MAGLRPDAVPRRSRGSLEGVVCALEVGVLVVVLDDGTEARASFGGAMLGALARDRGCAPQVGDRVLLRRWPDHRLTVECRLPEPRLARVIPLHGR